MGCQIGQKPSASGNKKARFTCGGPGCSESDRGIMPHRFLPGHKRNGLKKTSFVAGSANGAFLYSLRLGNKKLMTAILVLIGECSGGIVRLVGEPCVRRSIRRMFSKKVLEKKLICWKKIFRSFALVGVDVCEFESNEKKTSQRDWPLPPQTSGLKIICAPSRTGQ